MAQVRIFQRPKNSTQSGRARTNRWVLDFVAPAGQRADPLTGWAGGGDTRNQVRIDFPTAEEAIAYAEKQGYTYHVVPAPERKLKLQAYADNFR